jgi:hypothetical protein
MKKLLLLLGVAASTTFGLSSCEKLEEVLFESFQAPISFDVTIPVVTNTSSEIQLGESAVRFNLDSMIRVHTGNVFGAEVVGNMQVKEIGLEVVEGNATSNLSNFTYVKMAVGASGSTPVEMGPFTIPATANSSLSIPVNNSFNVKSMFSGSTVNFKVIGRARNATTQTMKLRVGLLVAFDR